MIADAMMGSKGITLLAQSVKFNEKIRERRRKQTELNTWASFKTFFHREHLYNIRAVTTAGKWEYAMVVHNIYAAPHTPTKRAPRSY